MPSPLNTVEVTSKKPVLFLGLSNFFKQFTLNSAYFGVSCQTLIWTDKREYQIKIDVIQVNSILF